MTDGAVDLVVEETGWLDALPDLESLAEGAVRAALAAAGIDARTVGMALLACDDARIAALNADFRGRSSPTNVLSWPAFALAPAAPGAAPPRPPAGRSPGRTPLGDVAIALQTCRREADAADRPLKNHCIHLILHGSLHLLGYDHRTMADAEVMEGIERLSLTALGIPDPRE